MATTRERFGFDENDVMREASRISHRRCLISFSTGKDSIATALAVRASGLFDEVVGFYMYQVPGNLDFIEESLAYYERVLFGDRRIIRVPHPYVCRVLNNKIHQPPNRVELIEFFNFQQHTAGDLQRGIAEELGWSESTLSAVGIRAADSQNRYAVFKRFGLAGAVSVKSGKFYPVFGWNKDRLIDEIKRSGVKLPIDYRVFGRTFDGMDARFLFPLKKHFPRDYERVIEWMPFADAEVFRYEHRQGDQS